jgi:hypothetical protein
LYFVRFLFFCIASTHIGAPYFRIGSTTPSYIVLRALCCEPHCIFAVLANMLMKVIDCASVWSICALKLNLPYPCIFQILHFYSLVQSFVIQINIDIPINIFFP